MAGTLFAAKIIVCFSIVSTTRHILASLLCSKKTRLLCYCNISEFELKEDTDDTKGVDIDEITTYDRAGARAGAS
jgi:hypothetical protein